MTELAPELALAGVPSRHRRHPLASFVLRRVGAGIATLFVVSILLFVGTNVLPGDVASAVLEYSVTLTLEAPACLSRNFALSMS